MAHNWTCYPVVIVGSGPSLSDEQCATVIERRRANACRVIVVNDNYLKVPNADVLFALDGPWWRLHAARIKEHCPEIGRFSCDARARKEAGATFVLGKAGRKLAGEGDVFIYRGMSSGFAAIGLALRWRARHICLIGFDCQRSEGKKGLAHWFGDHPREKLPVPQPFEQWREELDSLAKPMAERGVRFVQCSLKTATIYLTRGAIDAELADPEERLAA